MLRRGVLLGYHSCRTVATSSSLQAAEKCVNKVRLLGRVGLDPVSYEVEHRSVVFFRVATNHPKMRRLQDGIPEEYRVVWHDVTAFRPQLKEIVLKNVKKGLRVLCTGRLDSYKARENGRIHVKSSVILDDIIIVSHPSDRS